MKLITKEIADRLAKSPLYSQEKNPTPEVIVKFFTPWTNWTWFAWESELDAETGDWTFFGLVHGHEKELGYFRLSELESVRGPYGLKIERDVHFSGKKVDVKSLEVIS